MGVGYMNKNVRLHFIKMLFVLVVTVLAISVFGYTNVYGQNVLFDTNSVVKVVKDITIKSNETDTVSASFEEVRPINYNVTRVNNTISGNSINVGSFETPKQNAWTAAFGGVKSFNQPPTDNP